jgi:replicative DNA helicase
MINMKCLQEVKSDGAKFILENFLPIPQNAVTLLSASGGTGKTRLALVMADRHIQNTNEKVALWLTEDYEGQVRETFDDMVKAGIATADSITKMFLIINEPPQLAKKEQGIFKANYEEINLIGENLYNHDIKFSVFDPLLAFYGGDENDNSQARVFIQSFAEWAKKYLITTIIIHHANKDGNSRGATAFHDGVRARYELDIPRHTKETAQNTTFEEGERNEELFKNGFRIAKLKKDNWGIRKHLWRLSDGSDEITLKIMPPMINPYEKPIETEFKIDMPENF